MTCYKCGSTRGGANGLCWNCNMEEQRSLLPATGSEVKSPLAEAMRKRMEAKRTGILKERVRGNFATWRKGTRVEVEGSGRTVTIRRVNTKCAADLMNTMVGLPRKAIKLDPLNANLSGGTSVPESCSQPNES